MAGKRKKKGRPFGLPLFLLPVVVELEVQPHRDLASTRSASLRVDRGVNSAEVRCADIEVRVAEVGVVQHVVEGSLGTQVHALGDLEHLAETRRQVHGSGSDDRTDARVAEAADRSSVVSYRSIGVGHIAKTSGAGLAAVGHVASQTRACECSRIYPARAATAGRLDGNSCNPIRILASVTAVKAGLRTIEA